MKPDYSKSVLDINKMIVYQHSTVAIIQTSLENLEFNVDGELSIKLGTLNYSSYAIESDDFLSTTNDEKDDYWFTINGNQKEHGFYDFPEKIELRGGERKTVNFTKGAESDGAFIVYMPMNRPKGAESTRRDDQSSVPKVKMKY